MVQCFTTLIVKSLVSYLIQTYFNIKPLHHVLLICAHVKHSSPPLLCAWITMVSVFWQNWVCPVLLGSKKFFLNISKLFQITLALKKCLYHLCFLPFLWWMGGILPLLWGLEQDMVHFVHISFVFDRCRLIFNAMMRSCLFHSGNTEPILTWALLPSETSLALNDDGIWPEFCALWSSEREVISSDIIPVKYGACEC